MSSVMKGLVGEGDVVQGPWGDAPAARKPVAVDKSADIVTLKRKPSANVAKMTERFLTSRYAPSQEQLSTMDEEELAEEALRFLLDTFRNITKDMSAQDIYTLAQRMAREAYIQLDLDESLTRKGIVDEAEHVTVLYIDGKPSMKFTNKNEAHEQLERIKKKFPNKKFELKAEMRETKQRLDPKCWKGHHKEGTKIKGGVRVNNCVPNESVEEASSPAQQAAIAINMKKHHKKPKGETNEAAGTMMDPETALRKAREITKNIKYDDTVTDILVEIEMLAKQTQGIDLKSVAWAMDDVREAANALESAVYKLEDAWTDAIDQQQDDEDFNEALTIPPKKEIPFGRRDPLAKVPNTNADVMQKKDFQPPVKTPKRMEEDTAYAGGMGQGHSGQSYRKYKPKMAGQVDEAQLDELSIDTLADYAPKRSASTREKLKAGDIAGAEKGMKSVGVALGKIKAAKGMKEPSNYIPQVKVPAKESSIMKGLRNEGK